MEREKLFSVTASDCDWSYTRGTGAGGQKKNKTSSAVHCSHKKSGAHGYAEDTRSQSKNRELAFVRMAESKEFKKWHHLETLRRSGEMALIETAVEKEMKKIRIEGKKDGRWVPIEECEQ